MTRDKNGQALVPGFLEAASRTALRTEGNLPGGGGLFDIDRMRTGLERTPDQAGLFAPGTCGRCGGDGAAGAAGLCAGCDHEAEADDLADHAEAALRRSFGKGVAR